MVVFFVRQRPCKKIVDGCLEAIGILPIPWLSLCVKMGIVVDSDHPHFEPYKVTKWILRWGNLDHDQNSTLWPVLQWFQNEFPDQSNTVNFEYFRRYYHILEIMVPQQINGSWHLQIRRRPHGCIPLWMIDSQLNYLWKCSIRRLIAVIEDPST